jgi:hypothetical protein
MNTTHACRAAAVLSGACAALVVLSGGCSSPQIAGPTANRREAVRHLSRQSLRDDFDEMVLVTDIAGDALRQFMETARAKREELRAHKQNPETGVPARTNLLALLEQAAALNRTNEVREIQLRLAAHDKADSERRDAAHAEVLRRLSLLQQRTWAAHVLCRELARRLAPASLTNEQTAQIREFCVAAASGYVNEGTVARDPQLAAFWSTVGPALVSAVTQTVLSPDQRVAAGGIR